MRAMKPLELNSSLPCIRAEAMWRNLDWQALSRVGRKDSVTGMRCTQHRLDVQVADSSGYQNWTSKREVGEREQGAVHSHATHLKWRHESCDAMRGRAASKCGARAVGAMDGLNSWLPESARSVKGWVGRIELSQARSQTGSEYEEYELADMIRGQASNNTR
ncbi:hypothetical protein DFH09DRAFT_1097100 [Mycena vulgaris]|nr:hypothetical protein DFH09DRAFT_1097100 [Mycena vulgaris]